MWVNATMASTRPDVRILAISFLADAIGGSNVT